MVQGQKTNYQNTIIYKIVCKDVNIKETYGGHTTNIIKRRYKHKYLCNNEKDKSHNAYVYQFIMANGGWNNWELVWQKNFSCENKEQATLEEKKFIEQNKCELNSYRPIASEKEHKERKKEYDKKCRENHNNRDKILQKNKEIKTCQCGCQISKINLPRHCKSKKHIKLMNKITTHPLL